MTRKHSKGLFIVFAVLLVFLLFASFVNFTYPFRINGNYYAYSNFVSNLSLGQDVGKNVRIVYKAKPRDGENDFNFGELKKSTINQLTSILNSYGYYDVTAYESGESNIVVNVGNILSRDDESDLDSMIGNPVDICFSVDNADASNAILFAKDVADVRLQEGSANNQSVYYITIQFKNPADVYEKIKDANTLYALLGDVTAVNLSLSSMPEDFKETGEITFSNSAIKDSVAAEQYINMLKIGLLDLNLTQLDFSVSTPTYGSWATVSICVVSLIVVVAMFAYLIVKYKQMGWLACFNLMFFITLNLFIMQTIPFFHLNFSGVLAMLFVFVLVADTLITIIEKAKQHYQNETQFYIAFNMAKKETWMRILITLALVFVSGVVCVFMSSAGVQSFGWVMMVASVIGAITSLALMRLFINMYLPFNQQDGSKCNFNKGGKHD